MIQNVFYVDVITFNNDKNLSNFSYDRGSVHDQKQHLCSTTNLPFGRSIKAQLECCLDFLCAPDQFFSLVLLLFLQGQTTLCEILLSLPQQGLLFPSL